MEDFNPPIHTRADGELIIIANSSTDDWQQIAIDQAKAELKRRGITSEQQQKWLDEYKAQEEQDERDELERCKIEDYSILDKILMVLFWIKYIFYDWSLRKNGYELKAKRRLQLLGLGIGWTSILFIWAQFDYKIQEKKAMGKYAKEDSAFYANQNIHRDSAASGTSSDSK